MSTKYSRPRQRLTSFGLGILTGDALNQEGMLAQVQENLQFRIESARNMLMGNTSAPGARPLSRRKQIMDRRRDMFSSMTSMRNGGDDSGGPNRKPGTSGRIGDTGGTRRSSASTTVSDDTPSMSEVNRGTRERALDRGFEG